MKKILIIEDNQQILTHLSYIAQEINSSNKIYAFKNLDEAYRCALENDIDLFIVDIIFGKRKARRYIWTSVCGKYQKNRSVQFYSSNFRDIVRGCKISYL